MGKEGALADAVLEVAWDRAGAEATGLVEVFQACMAQLLASGHKGHLRFPKRQLTYDVDGPAPAVVGAIAKVGIVLQAAEIREHALPVPAAGAELGPTIVVGRLAAKRDGGVDGAATPDDAAAW